LFCVVVVVVVEALLLFWTPFSVASQVEVVLDGEPLSFDVPPVIHEDRTLVPLRFISESLGAAVDWDEESRIVYIAAPEPEGHRLDGCLREEDVLELWLLQGEGCGTVEDDELGTETRFYFAGAGIEETSQIGDYLYEYTLPDLDWREQVKTLLSGPADLSPPAGIDCDEIMKRLAGLLVVLRALKGDKSRLEREISELEAEKAKLAVQLADLKRAKEKCPQKIAALEAEIKKLEERVIAAKVCRNTSFGWLRECEARHGRWAAECSGYRKDFEQAHARLRKLKADLRLQRAALETLRKSCSELPARITEVDSALHYSVSPQISMRKLDIAELEAEVSALAGKIAELGERYRECIAEREAAERLRQRAEEAKERAERSVQRAEKRATGLEKRLRELKERFPGAVYPKSAEELRGKLEENKRKIDEGYEERDEAKMVKSDSLLPSISPKISR